MLPRGGANLINAEGAATALLDRYGISRPRFSVEDLAYAEGITIERSALRNVDAWLVRQGVGRGIIRVRDDMEEEGRFRFSIGHELGHWMLHPALSQGFLCTATDLSDYSRSPQEVEANAFAATLLMPRKWLSPDEWRGDPSLNMISELAQEFGTTLTAAARRFIEVSNRAVVVVFSSAGKVQWSVKSPRAKAVYIANGSDVPEHSLTLEVLTEMKNPTEPEEVGLSTWLPSWRAGRDAELFEDVRISQRYGWAITLLWIPHLG